MFLIFTMDFNIGHLATILTGIVSIVVVWQKLRDRVDSLQSRMSKQETDMGEITKMGVMTTIAQHERRITSLEGVVADIRTIQADISWIKHWLNAERRDKTDTDV